MKLYFAYGSNMDLAQMRKRCPSASLFGVGELKGFRLEFNIYSPRRRCGCADVVPARGTSVWGLIFRVSDAEMERLDRFEGVPFHYQRATYNVSHFGKRLRCEGYEVRSKVRDQVPSRSYLGVIKKAARDYAFPRAYFEYISSFDTKPVRHRGK